MRMPESLQVGVQIQTVTNAPLNAEALRGRWYDAMKVSVPSSNLTSCQCRGQDGRTMMEPKGGLASVKLEWAPYVLCGGVICVRATSRCICSFCGESSDYIVYENHPTEQLHAEADWL